MLPATLGGDELLLELVGARRLSLAVPPGGRGANRVLFREGQERIASRGKGRAGPPGAGSGWDSPAASAPEIVCKKNTCLDTRVRCLDARPSTANKNPRGRREKAVGGGRNDSSARRLLPGSRVRGVAELEDRESRPPAGGGSSLPAASG